MNKILSNCLSTNIINKLGVASLTTVLFIGATPLALAKNPLPTIQPDAPNRYVVKKGDTLWDISGQYLKKPWQWRDIWAANKHVKNPHRIYPGDVLLMCVIKGNTLIGIDTGEGCAGIERDMTTVKPAIEVDSKPSQSVITTPLSESIPPIPLSAIETWLDRVLIVNPQDFKTTPYVVASKLGNLITGQGDTIYAKGVPLIVGQRYGVYRQGESYIDPLTNQNIGLEVRQVASGVVTKVSRTNDSSSIISTIELVKSYESEVREGDRIFVEMALNVPPVFYPKAANVDRGGQIIRIIDSINSAGKGSVVAINLGRENGATEGDVLTILQRGSLIRDIYDKDMPVRLPSEQAGHLMVFKTFEKISYAYVLESQLPLNVGDRLLAPAS